MRPLLVKELAELLNKAVNEGKGDYIALVSDDDECNDYHALWEHNLYQGDDFEYYEEGNPKLRNTITIQ